MKTLKFSIILFLVIILALINIIWLTHLEHRGLIRKEDEAFDAQKTFACNAVDILGCFGKGKIDEAREAVKRLQEKNAYLQYKEIMELFRTYKEARITMPTIPRTELVVGIGIKAVNHEERKKLIEWVGHLEDLYPEGKAIDDLFDIALKFRQEFGKRTDDVAKSFKGLNILMAQGVSADDALATLYSAFKVEQNGDDLIKLAQFMAEHKEVK